MIEGYPHYAMQDMSEPKAIRCQSCGMVIGDWFSAPLPDGSASDEWCRFCFKEGVFTEPDVTKDEMIKRTFDLLMRTVRPPEEKARGFANLLIPQLKRWKKDSLDL